MNEFFKRMIEGIKTLWAKWTLVQKLITGAVLLVAVVAVILVLVLGSSSDTVSLLSASITDTNQLDRISARLDQEGITHQIQSGSIRVRDEKIARQARAILFRENLIPKDVSPWDVFNTGSKWTVTDLENNVKVQRAITRTLESHIESLGEIDSARVILTFPEKKLLASTQTQKKASVIITPRPGVNMQEQNRIKGIENLVLFAVDGLTKENLVISDSSGHLLNSNDEMLAEMNKLDLGKKQINYKLELQNYYASSISQALEKVFPDRILIANLELDLNFDAQTFEENKILPTILSEDNPATPKNESVYVDKIDAVTEKKRVIYAGTGIHPDGPGGVEGNVVDGYKDQVGQIVEHDETHDIVQSKWSSRLVKGEKSPIKIEKFAIGIFVDGVWVTKRNSKGEVLTSERGGIEREFIPVSSDDVKRIEQVIKNAINFDITDGDKVTVQAIQFDRTKEFELADQAFRQKKIMTLSIIILVASIVGMVFLAFIVRAIIKSREAARRRREEEEARKQAAMREAALRRAEEESANMQMSVGSKNAEEEERAKQLARENPENVANLIRTWLAEE